MSTVVMEQKNKIHPHKFTLWMGIGSIVMMFAGLTSAYIVKRNQVNWITFDLLLHFGTVQVLLWQAVSFFFLPPGLFGIVKW